MLALAFLSKTDYTTGIKKITNPLNYDTFSKLLPRCKSLTNTR